MKFNFLLIFCLLINLYSQESQYDKLVKQGVNQIYNLDFDEAQKTFAQFKSEFPKHPAGNFFEAMVIWWRINLDMDNEKYDKELLKKLDQTIDYCDELIDKNEEDADAIFFKGGALGFRGLLYSIRESWFNAAGDGSKALPLVKKVYNLDPSNVDAQLGFGIYNYFSAALPQKYPVVKPLMVFLPKGDKAKGIKQLEYVARSGKYANIESKYTLLKIYHQFENDIDKSMEYAESLFNDFPNNTVFHRYLGQIHIKKNGYLRASEIFEDIYERCNKKMVGYNERVKREAIYYIGVKHRMEKDIAKAIAAFEETEILSKKVDTEEETGFYVNSILYLGMLNDLAGKRDKAKKYYEQVADMKDFNDSRKKAKEYLKTPYNNL